MVADQASQGGERVRAAEVIAALSAKVIWCTGFDPDFSWIDLPVIGAHEHEPAHHRGVVANQPGLYGEPAD
jgi:hypothetical protein